MNFTDINDRSPRLAGAWIDVDYLEPFVGLGQVNLGVLGVSVEGYTTTVSLSYSVAPGLHALYVRVDVPTGRGYQWLICVSAGTTSLGCQIAKDPDFVVIFVFIAH
jgi:hypothetical protein